MRRALSQPVLWMSSPRTARRDSSGQGDGPGSSRPAVHWEGKDSSEDEAGSPRDARTLNRSLNRVRRFSMSPGIRTDLDASDIDIGIASRFDRESPIYIQRPHADILDSREIRMTSLFCGRGGDTCAKYLAENMTTIIDEALQRFDDESTALTESFKICDSAYNLAHPHEGSGSTAMICLVNKKTIHVAWTGDSRAVFCCGNDAKPITWEHTPTNLQERKRILDSGGLVVGGQIAGVLATSRGFGDTDLKTHFSPGVFVAEPSVATFTIDDSVSSARLCFLVIASASVFSVFSNDVVCKIVAKYLARHDYNATIAAGKLAKSAEKRCHVPCGAAVVLWCHTTQRSRSSSATSWRSLRSFSTMEVDDS